MLQFYCLSVLMNLLVGMIIVFAGDLASANDAFSGDSLDNDSSDDIFGDELGTDSYTKSVSTGGKLFAADSFVNDEIFRLVLGVLAAFVGVIKLLPFTSDSVAILGDFFPALAGIFGGACLIMDYINDMSGLPEIVQTIFIDNRRYIGFFCLAIALLHFLVPQIILI